MEHMPLLIDPEESTLPGIFRNAGYATACVGKWHLGWGDRLHPDWQGRLSPGPLQCGFDYFFGVPYSHNSSPELQAYVENDSMVVRNRRMDQTATRLSEKALSFIRRNADQRFFLYYPLTNIHLPHTPDSAFLGSSGAGLYGEFITEMDWAVGQVLNCLDSLGLGDNTLVIFTSDNGAKTDSLWSLNGHRPNGSLRGEKATIYGGGTAYHSWPGGQE